MIIKKDGKKKKFFSLFQKVLLLNFFFSLILGTLLLISLFTSWNFSKKTYTYLDYLAQAGRIEYLNILNIGYQAFIGNFHQLDKINLNIDFKNTLKLENFRKESLEKKSLGSSGEIPRFKAIIGFDNKKIKSSIRLKGERPIHYNDNKKLSYKVEIKGKNNIFGLKKFSLQKPRVRNYLYEWVFLEMVGDFNLIKIKYKFIDLDVNGSSHGVYVVQEAFGKELIERNKRRNGPIFGFDDDKINFSTNFKIEVDDPVLEVYNKKYWYKNENFDLVKVASNKFKNFINGERKLEDTFDLEKFAALFAIVDANYTFHTLSRGNLKLYYNPINGLFEPIAHDGQRSNPNYKKFNGRFDNKLVIEDKATWWVKKFFYTNNDLNDKFYSLYLKYLKKISSEEYVNSFFKKKNKEIKKLNSKIYGDYFLFANGYSFGPGLYFFSLKDFKHRSEVIKNKIDSLKKQVHIIDDGTKYKINLFFSENMFDKPYITYTNLQVKKIFCQSSDTNLKYEKILINKKINIFKNTYIDYPSNIKKDECTHFEIFDKLNQKKTKVKINFLNSKHNFKDVYDLNNITKYFYAKENKLFLKNNISTIKENIFIPKNYKVIINSGQKIILTDNAFIFSKSSWEVNGTLNNKVIITGEKNNFGGGLIISDTQNRSYFKNAKFKYLTGMQSEYTSEKGNILKTITYEDEKKKNLFKKRVTNVKKITNQGYLIFGSLNFNNTVVDLDNISFEKIASEDGLNIINSKFKLDNLFFKDNKSDALDIDFANGEIKNSSFENIGNDAIDFSGTEAKVENVRLANIGDKLVSIGENSNISIKKIVGSNSLIGLASKDGSSANVEDLNFNDIQIPFIAYNKKQTYGFGKILINNNLKIKNFKKKWVSDENSKIIFQNKDVSTKSKKSEILSIINQGSISKLEDINAT